MIDGGDGVNTAVFAGNRADFTVNEDNVNAVLGSKRISWLSSRAEFARAERSSQFENGSRLI